MMKSIESMHRPRMKEKFWNSIAAISWVKPCPSNSLFKRCYTENAIAQFGIKATSCLVVELHVYPE